MRFFSSFWLIFTTIFFTQIGWGQTSILTLGAAYTESFTSFVGTAGTVPANWTNSGSGNWNGTDLTGGTGGGWYGNGNMAYLGSGSASNGNATWRFRNNTGSTITSFTISFEARMWRSGSNSPTVTASYSSNTTGTVPAAGVLTAITTFNDATPNIAIGTVISQTINSISIANGDYIYIRFTHPGGSSSDKLGWDEVTLTFNGGCVNPGISTHPSSTTQNYCQGETATALSVAGTGTGLTYQWYSNTTASNVGGTLISSATSSTYTPLTTSTGTLYYYCIITGTCGSPVTSNCSGSYVVNSSPANPTGTINTTSNCGATLLGFSNPSSSNYWQTTSTGVSTSNPTTSDLSVSSSGTYYVRAYNAGCWSLGSVSQAVTVITPPSITTHPVNQTANIGATTSFSVAATNASSYQWEVSTDNGISWSNVGTNSNTFSISSAAITMNGYRYRVIVSGTIPCTPITSNVGILSVVIGPCLEQNTFSALPTDWSRTNVTFSGGEAVFDAANGDLTTPSVAYPTSLTFNLRRSTNTSAKTLYVEVATSSGGPYTTVGTYDHSNTTSGSTTAINVDLSAYNIYPNVYIRFRKQSSTTSPWYIRDVKVNCNEPCTHTLTSFVPTSGPVGTELTITGAGFTPSTLVRIGGTLASVTFLTSTTLIAEVQPGAVTGEIDIIENGCIVISTSDFTIIEESGTCPPDIGDLSDVFISEVYDSDALNNWYIELFNPTSSPINLATGNYQIIRYATIGGGGGATTINLSGTIPPMSVFTMRLGYSTGGCSGVTFDFDVDLGGINANNEIRLVRNGTILDVVHTPNETGFSILRDTDAVAPSVTFTASDWITLSGESCSDFGLFELPIFTPSVSAISSNSCSSLDFSVTTAPGNSGTLTYKWYYNDGTSTGWTQVINSTFSGLSISGETTNQLVITPSTQPITDIEGFQFYCEVTENGTCINVSNAEQFEGSEDRYYKSTQSGNWSTINTWLMAPAISGPWTAACTYPTAANSDYISIENGHTVTLNIDLSADQIIVQTTGILQLNEKLTVPNGNATTEDLQVIGTLIDNGNTTNGLEFTGGGTWLLDPQGTVIKTWSSSVAQYKNNYQGGISAIPSTANWYYRYVGNDNVVTTTEGMYYPNLYFESTSGFHSWDASDELLNGSTGTAVVKGNLSVGTTNTGTVEVFNNNTFATPISVLGNVYIGVSSSLRNNSQGTGIGTGFEIKGDSIVVNGIYTIDVSGSGRTILSGTNQQHIVSTSTGTFNTADFVLNNTNGAKLNGIDVNISNTLTFTDGIIYTNIAQNDKVNITNNSTTAIISGQAQSATNRYIDGKLQWLTATGNTYRFPVGSDKTLYGAQGFDFTADAGSGAILGFLEINNTAPIYNYAYCDLETHPGTGGVVNAGNGLPGYDGIADQINFNLHSPLQWNITNTSGSVTQYDLVVLATGNQNINPITTVNGTDIRYLMKNGQPGNPNVSTITATGFGDLGFDLCPNQYTLLDLTSFSHFTLDGANQGGTVLPIEMVIFEGKLVSNNSAQLRWVTATELNNDYFTLSYSKDGSNFEYLTTLDGAGNSTSEREYSYVHKRLSKGVHYYQLHSTDFDGITYHRGIVSVEVELFNIYYNTITSTIELPNSSNVKIYSTEGKLVAEGNGVNSIPFHHKGMFLIHDDDTGMTERIVVR